jgi:hypothetical protein
MKEEISKDMEILKNSLLERSSSISQIKISILTQNIYGINAPIKKYQTGLKNKTQPCVAYKRLISLNKKMLA